MRAGGNWIMVLRVFCAAIFAVGGFSGLAFAQIPTSTADRVTTPGAQAQALVRESDRIFRKTVACAAERAGTRARHLLATSPGSAEESRIAWSFQSRLDFCLSGYQGIRFPLNMLRGGFAEIIYHQEFPGGLKIDGTPDSAATAWTEPRLDGGGNEASELSHSAARCLVVSHPLQARNLLATEPLSEAEQHVFDEIQPLLGPCLFQGVKFTASRQMLRGLIAEAALGYAIARRDGFDKLATAAAAKK